MVSIKPHIYRNKNNGLMSTSDIARPSSSISEVGFRLTFGEWLKYRRKELDLTQADVAKRANCSIFALRKIEAGDRRPSKQLARLLAQSLEIPDEKQNDFVKIARGELSPERLSSPNRATTGGIRPVQKPDPSSGNLPAMSTSFIGREPELTTLGQMLRDPQCRLISLIGPGGIGKTRLAIEAGVRHKDLFPDGVWFISLAPINSPALIVPAIADALNFRFQDPAQPQAQLLDYLKGKRALLELDNAEHLLEGTGIFAEILQKAPGVKLLATSRERLSLLSEWVLEIQGLPVPSSDQVAEFEAFSAVELFLQSARRVQAGFALRDDDLRWVLHICRMVEGMPLGIELAAAWVELLSCEEIAIEIENNLDFLAVSMRDLPERHRSMRATLDHSWKLLSPDEKRILSRLSVFRGSFRLEAAKEICGASLPVLSYLKNKTLIRRTDRGYFNIHELIRQYAESRLAEDSDEEGRIKDRHAAYYAQRLADWETALKSASQLEALNEMAQKIDNIRQAWQRIVSQYHPDTMKNNQLSPDLFHRSLFSLSLFYELRCRNQEAISVLSESMDCLRAARTASNVPENFHTIDALLGHVIAYLGLHYLYILEYQRAREYLEEAIGLLEIGSVKVERAQAQVILSAVCYKQGHLHKAADLLVQSRSVFREAGEGWWYLLATINLAQVYRMSGKNEESQLLFQEGSQLVEPGDLRLGLPIRNGFAYRKYLMKDYSGAEKQFLDNLQLSFQLGFDRQTAAIYIELCQIALNTDRIDLAEEYISKSIGLLSKFGESHELAVAYIYDGKCLAARSKYEAARERFRQVVRIGQTWDMFYLIYWGLVNIAITGLMEGKIETAFRMALVIRQYPIEHKPAYEDCARLLAGILPMFQQEPFNAVMNEVESKGIENLLNLL